MEYFLVMYDSRVVIYERKMFIRLATDAHQHRRLTGPHSHAVDPERVEATPLRQPTTSTKNFPSHKSVHTVGTPIGPRVECDQIGQFFKVLGDIFSYKSSQKFWWPLGHFGKYHFSSKITLASFWAFFENLGYFYSNIWSRVVASLFWASLKKEDEAKTAN